MEMLKLDVFIDNLTYVDNMKRIFICVSMFVVNEILWSMLKSPKSTNIDTLRLDTEQDNDATNRCWSGNYYRMFYMCRAHHTE